ncbi:DNA topology modulation protein FlaR [Amycolatopsis taiwanensis]|uniref:Topology modulation protein n=1 Tax=Amycolatopsis taiwanensis TaxID=342230 RepID=A0A9W6R2S6_9PSEU|nr:DNA topology modulation protein FlaR [Amycolatopsis taiwanensis]GLY67438.1 topology modulation protein [Amycolatopsis taiwanensis]
MRRVLVIGCSGSGKSTFARRLAALLDLPVTHLDRHYWRPGWVEAPDDEFRAAQQAVVVGERWVIDGNYSGSMDIRLPRADTIVFLDLPRWRCLLRIARRTLRGWGRDGQAAGCPEHLDPAFWRWVWRWHRGSRPHLLARLAEQGSHTRQVVLSSPREVTGFLNAVSVGGRE